MIKCLNNEYGLKLKKDLPKYESWFLKMRATRNNIKSGTMVRGKEYDGKTQNITCWYKMGHNEQEISLKDQITALEQSEELLKYITN